MAVEVEAASEFRFEPAERLFEFQRFTGQPQPPTYDVAADGRFVTIQSDLGGIPLNQLSVVVNWHQELLERVPIP